MFGLFKCAHPFSSLAVQKEQTLEIKCRDFESVTYHLFCRKCGADLTLNHAKLIGGVKEFLNRKET